MGVINQAPTDVDILLKRQGQDAIVSRPYSIRNASHKCTAQ